MSAPSVPIVEESQSDSDSEADSQEQANFLPDDGMSL